VNTVTLSYILAVAQEKSFSKAAKKLFISQPALSQYVHKLEEEIGTPIFHRTMPLELTYAGEQYISIVKKILEQEHCWEQILFDIKNEKAGRISVGAGPLNCAYILPEAAVKFQRLYPSVEISVHEIVEPDLFREVSKSVCGIALTTLPVEDSFRSEIIARDEFVLAIPEAFAPEKKTVRISDFQNHTFIVLPKNFLMHKILNGLCEDENFIPSKKLECGSVISALYFVRAGAGVSIVPKSVAHQIKKWENIVFKPVEGCNIQRHISVFYKKDKLLTKPEKAFIDILADMLQTL